MPGSDKYINYQLRPAKSVERKMICSLIRQIQLSGGLTDFRYIGMGAKYFVDFMLIHHQFGTRNMISIEAQKELKQRYDFNKPLGFIEMKYGTTTEITFRQAAPGCGQRCCTGQSLPDVSGPKS